MNRRIGITLIASLLLGVLALFGISRVNWDVNVLDILPEELDMVKGLNQFRELFQKEKELIIVVQGEDPAELKEAIQSLSRFLVARDDVSYANWKPPLKIGVGTAEEPGEGENDTQSGGIDLRFGQASELLAYSWFNGDPSGLRLLAAGMASDAALAARLDETRELLEEAQDTGDAIRFEVSKHSENRPGFTMIRPVVCKRSGIWFGCVSPIPF